MVGMDMVRLHLLAEPMGRNTAAAIGFAAKILMEKSPEEAIGVFPADHIIENPDRFLEILKQAEKVANQGHLVTLGIEPARPETGYGYIKMGDVLPAPKNRKAYKTAFHVARRFVEKPNFDRAVKYLNDGGYRWNAGMFVFSFPTMTESLLKHRLRKTFHRPKNHVLNKSTCTMVQQKIRMENLFATLRTTILKISIFWLILGETRWVAIFRHFSPKTPKSARFSKS